MYIMNAKQVVVPVTTITTGVILAPVPEPAKTAVAE